MTIVAWILCIIISIIMLIFGTTLSAFCFMDDNDGGGIISIILTFVIIGAIFGGNFWYYNHTASGQRALVDEKSELRNGIERTINVYTADGDLIAQYKGKIDIDTNDGGYVKFDFEGKRYIYYNCFVETIADIN